jgi:hypothetical protein
MNDTRNEALHCRSCTWFQPSLHYSSGQCRRYAPSSAGHPVVFENDWCGDHKPDERFS